MEFDENEELDEQQGDFVEIYSRNAVLWFSILVDPLIGGILLIINLWVAGYKKAIAPVVAFILFFEGIETYFELWFTKNYKLSHDVKTINDLTANDLIYMGAGKALQIAGSLILAFYVYKKYFPENDYYPRSIVPPLMITIFLFFVMAYYSISF